MPTVLIASLMPGEGRTSVAAALGALLAETGHKVRLLRVRTGEQADPAAEDDARVFAAAPGCSAPTSAVSEQDAHAQSREAGDEYCFIEAPPGSPAQLAERLSSRVVLVTAGVDGPRLGDIAAAAGPIGDALLGFVVTRQPEGRADVARSALAERGLGCLGVVPEDALLAGPNLNEIAEALHASTLAEAGNEDEAVESVMLGPISADPGQPYFLRHGSKAVLNRFDKMDLHLAALATEPDCLILTGGQMPSPYFIDRLQGGDSGVTVLLAPDDTVRTMEVLDDLYLRTRFSGQRKMQRALELVRQHVPIDELIDAMSSRAIPPD